MATRRPRALWLLLPLAVLGGVVKRCVWDASRSSTAADPAEQAAIAHSAAVAEGRSGTGLRSMDDLRFLMSRPVPSRRLAHSDGWTSFALGPHDVFFVDHGALVAVAKKGGEPREVGRIDAPDGGGIGFMRPLAVEGANVFVATASGVESFAVPSDKDGGSASERHEGHVVAKSGEAATHLFADERAVYWSETRDQTLFIKKAARRGGTSIELAKLTRPDAGATSEAVGFHLAMGTSALFYTFDNGPAIFRLPKDGGPATRLFPAAESAEVTSLVVRGDYVYWGMLPWGDHPASIERAPVSGGPPERVYVAEERRVPGGGDAFVAPSLVAIDDNNAYFQAILFDRIMRVPLFADLPTVTQFAHVTPRHTAYQLALDEDAVYWVEPEGSEPNAGANLFTADKRPPK